MEHGTAGIQNRTWLHVLLILFFGSLIYASSLHAPFTFDDTPNIVDNPALKSFGNLFAAAQGHDELLEPKLKPQIPSRIIGYLTFALNYQLHGLSVFGYHLFNLAIHLVNALLVYALVKVLTLTRHPPFRTLGDDNADSSIPALFIALFFVCHPIQTQAVTYVVQRFTSLATLFYLCSILAYLQARLAKQKRTSGLYLATSLIFAVLAMKTKEFALTLPFVLLLIEFLFLEGTKQQRLCYLLPFLPTLAIIPWGLLSTALSDGNDVSVASFEFGSSADFTRFEYFITQLSIIVIYLRLLIFPTGQNLDYDYPLLHDFFTPTVLGSAALLAALVGSGIFLWRIAMRNPSLSTPARLGAFGIFWFFITISAESSIIKIKDLMFEHRLYLPSAGFFMALVALGVILKRQLDSRQSPLAKALLPCGVCIVILLAFATHARNFVWQDEIRLWQDIVAKSPNKARPHNNLALAYDKQGRYDEALRENRISLKLKDDHGVHLNSGNIFLKQNRLDEALGEFRTAIALNPEYEKAYNGECSVHLRQKRYSEAAAACQTAIKLKSDYAEAHNLLGLARFALGETTEALQEFNLAIKSKPDVVIFHNNLAKTFYKTGNFAAALDEYRTVATLDPSYLGVYPSIARIHLDLGRISEAMNACQTALRFKPDYQEALDLLEEAKRAQAVGGKI